MKSEDLMDAKLRCVFEFPDEQATSDVSSPESAYSTYRARENCTDRANKSRTIHLNLSQRMFSSNADFLQLYSFPTTNSLEILTITFLLSILDDVKAKQNTTGGSDALSGTGISNDKVIIVTISYNEYFAQVFTSN